MSVCCVECFVGLGCLRWGWNRCTHTGADDSATWPPATADEFEPVPHLCRLTLAVYEEDLRHPQFPPLGGYRLNPNFVIKRVTHEQTLGHAPPYIIYLDHTRREIVMAIRGLNLKKESDYKMLLDNRLGKHMFDGGFVHHGLLKSAVWLLNEESENLRRLWVENGGCYKMVFVGHSLGGGVAALLTVLVVNHREMVGGIPREMVKCYSIAPTRCLSLNLAVKYADVIYSIVLQDDFLPRTPTSLEDIFQSIFCLPCLLFVICMRDTFIPEDTKLKDPRRLYAPGRMYHIVDRKFCRFDNVSIGNSVIGTLKNMFNGPWTSWKKVPVPARNAMWDRFKTQYQWDPTIDGAIYAAWEKVLKKRFPCVVGCARKKAEAAAKDGTPPFDGTNIGVLRGYGPTWIRHEYWIKMVERWESPTWKAISSANKCNRNSQYEGSISKHTGGSITIARHRHRIEKKEKRKMSTVELFKVTHMKKGSNGELITPKATHMLSRYNDLVVKKYGEDVTSQPELGDVELWTEAVGGVKKGRIYGFGAPYDPQLVMTGIPSTIWSTQLGTSEEVRLLKEELKKRDEELKKRDEQIAEQQRTFEQRCEQRIEEQVQHVAAQMRQMMEQVARFTGAPISFTLSGPSPSGTTTCNTNETNNGSSS